MYDVVSDLQNTHVAFQSSVECEASLSCNDNVWREIVFDIICFTTIKGVVGTLSAVECRLETRSKLYVGGLNIV